MASRALTKLRKLALALPESHEETAWGAPTFRVRNKMFAMYVTGEGHHHPGRDAAWIKAGPGEQAGMVAAAPTLFFVPPYVGPSGWVGVWLDKGADWETVDGLLRDGYRLIAPKKLIARLDDDEDKP